MSASDDKPRIIGPGALIRRGPARVFVDGRELNGGINSMRWDGEKLVAEIPVEILGTLEPPPEVVSIEVPAEGTERSGTITWTEPRASLWTRLVCALWWGHRPCRTTLVTFITDELTCRCGKVTDTAENVERCPNPWKIPRG